MNAQQKGWRVFDFLINGFISQTGGTCRNWIGYTLVGSRPISSQGVLLWGF